MISGRYRTQELVSKWSESASPACQAPSCLNLNVTENLSHILAKCPSLEQTRRKLKKFTEETVENVNVQEIKELILNRTEPHHPDFSNFLIDCSTFPEVISLSQLHGQEVHDILFRVTRMWCFSLHKDRLKILGRWSSSY